MTYMRIGELRQLLLVQRFVLAGDLEVVVVTADIIDALALEVGDALWMEDEVFEGIADAVVGGLNVDDGAQLGLAKDVVAFGLTTANTDDALRHGQQWVHRRGIGIELVEDGVAAVYQSLVLGKGHALDLDELHLVGVGLEHVFGSTEHDVGALVSAAAAADTYKYFGEG